MRLIIFLSIVSFASAQLTDPDIRPGNQVSRIRDHNHQRDVADTMSYSNTWRSAFIQSPGDAMLVAYQMPADGIIKGVNIPVNEWGTGDQQLTVALYELTYPYGLDASGNYIRYPLTTVDGQGWIGGYDMQPDSGAMVFDGDIYSPPGTAPECSSGVLPVADYSADPLGQVDSPFGPPGIPQQGLIWPDGFTAATLDPVNNPGSSDQILDNWIATEAYGTEPVLTAGTWVGVLVYFSGSGGGDDESCAFWYTDADPLGFNDPWVALKFYNGCGGTSGSGGWHIRHWVFNFELAVLFPGCPNYPRIFEWTHLVTTLSTEPRNVDVHIADGNPSGGPSGIDSASVFFQLDSLTAAVNEIPLSLTAGTVQDGTWSGALPGQEPGTTVYWWIKATNINGITISIPIHSYYIFLSRPSHYLLFNNTDPLYGNVLYVPYLYYEWGTDAFDIWDASYGNITGELVGNYDVIIEVTSAGGGASYNTDAVLQPWFATGDKVYIVEGDEWLGARYGWIGDMDIPDGDFARDIGIAHYYPDINSGDISRLFPVAGDEIGGPMATFLTDSNCVLDYDPEYDPGHTNWLDGIAAGPGAIVAFEAHDGEVDTTTGAEDGTTLYTTAIYGTYSTSKAAFFGFDVISLYARDYTASPVTEYWVGAWDYDNYLVSPFRLALDWAGAELNVNARTDAAPQEIVLRGNYPNPFNPVTTIHYELPEPADVRLAIYDLLGREIADLIGNNQITPAGQHQIKWDASHLSSGIYFIRFSHAKFTQTRKILLLK